MVEKVWVVGCEGLVGKEVMKFLEVHAIEHFGTTHVQADVTDIKLLRSVSASIKPTLIINCSAYVNVDLAEGEGREIAYHVNVVGVVNLAHVAKEKKAKLIHIGTDYVFNGANDKDYVEADQACPINRYGMTKLEGEQRMFEVYPQSICVRTASLYGRGKRGLVSTIIEGLETLEEVKAVIDQTSTPTYIPHLVQALWAVRNQSGIFHFVNKGYASRFDLVEEVKNYAEVLGRPMKCQRLIGVRSEELKRAALRPIRSVLSTHKIERYLSEPICCWKGALRQYLRELGWVSQEIF